ncbi:MAG: hypothetical protein KatS3mg105_1541 [Gemmatales bacterium]|nr:MAG: hypothetical protein KatS3mg105_1541 [Gemmatales bacterium]
MKSTTSPLCLFGHTIVNIVVVYAVSWESSSPLGDSIAMKWKPLVSGLMGFDSFRRKDGSPPFRHTLSRNEWPWMPPWTGSTRCQTEDSQNHVGSPRLLLSNNKKGGASCSPFKRRLFSVLIALPSSAAKSSDPTPNTAWSTPVVQALCLSPASHAISHL